MKITFVPAQIVLSPSLLASVGAGLLLLVRMISSVFGAHDPFDTVHLSVALVFRGTPVTEVLNEFISVIVAVPPITLHCPVPITGGVAFSVNVPLLHCAISAPATALLGVLSNRMVTSSELDAQTPLLMVHLNT